MRIVSALIILAALVLLAALALIYSGLYNVAATEPHLEVTRWALDTALRNSVRRQARDIVAPPLDEPALLQEGAGHYAAHCAQCHGVPGAPLPAMAQHMRPRAPHLAEVAMDWAPHELFWIAKHGLRMTGMPAWGPIHSDEELWAMVAVVQALPRMSAEQYRELAGGEHAHADDSQ